MKVIQLFPVFFLFFLGCEKDAIIKEVPDQIIVLEPCATLVDSNFNFKEYFFDTIQKNIILTQECRVYVSFISEETSNRSTLGWYSYQENHPPVKSSEINKNVLFPNISNKGEGGELEAGYTLQLGESKFPTGTIIGFFLVVHGWKDGVINYDKPTYYTNSELNEGGRKQYLLFKETECNNVVICFEDASVASLSHIDYNDVIFTINDNLEGYESTSFDLRE